MTENIVFVRPDMRYLARLLCGLALDRADHCIVPVLADTVLPDHLLLDQMHTLTGSTTYTRPDDPGLDVEVDYAVFSPGNLPDFSSKHNTLTPNDPHLSDHYVYAYEIFNLGTSDVELLSVDFNHGTVLSARGVADASGANDPLDTDPGARAMVMAEDSNPGSGATKYTFIFNEIKQGQHSELLFLSSTQGPARTLSYVLGGQGQTTGASDPGLPGPTPSADPQLESYLPAPGQPVLVPTPTAFYAGGVSILLLLLTRFARRTY